MGYKSILTYLDGHRASEAQFANAIRVAKHCDATLTTIAYAYNIWLPNQELAKLANSVFSNIYEHAQAMAKARADKAKEGCLTARVRSSVEILVSVHEDWGDAFGQRARFSDLVVLGSIDDETSDRTASDALEAALYIGDVPVLICPPDMRSFAPKTVLIAWNGSREALRSVRAAMPLLQEATTVDVVMVDRPDSDKATAGDLVRLLSHHGIDATISALSGNFKSTSEALRARAENLGAGLIVMGAYSHSWFRESVLGGVTREIMGRSKVPVLFAH